jgi:glycosyltransferase involved in cell wall biosynthesis
VKPRVLFVSHTLYDLPLPPGLEKKWEAVAEHVEYLVLASAGRIDRPDPRFDVRRFGFQKLEGAAFYMLLPTRIRRAVETFHPDVIIFQSPFEAVVALLALRFTKTRPKLVVEVHGDWRSAARLYGSPVRHLYARVADRLALAGLRSADATRAIGSYTAGLAQNATGRPPLAIFPTFSDIESFLEYPPRPLPRTPTVIWVGVLERSKNPELLAAAWPLVVAQNPQARLVVVGVGRLERVIRQLCVAFPHSVQWIPKLAPSDVAALFDQATVLALPSQSEGLGRVIIEAFSRGRPVVATAVGGIPEMVVTDRNGILISAGDADALAAALLRVLNDHELATRLGQQALADARSFHWSPGEYALAVRRLVDRVREAEGSPSRDAASITAQAPTRE